MYVLALGLLCQWIEPQPATAEVGQPVEVTVRSANAEPMPSIPVQVRAPRGELQTVGTTDASGTVQFKPEDVGTYELSAELPGRDLLLVVPFEAVPPQRRWLYILLCVPAGAVLLWWNLRRAGRGDASEPVP